MSRTLGMYDEAGFFPALCCHGFALIVVDMVKSRELAKYGFAVVNHLLHVLGKLGLRYNIGCKYGKMSFVGVFHGSTHVHHGSTHVHHCLVSNLTMHVPSIGMETLEDCKSYFLKLNVLMPGTHHASRFHRQQAITTYLKHTDTFDTVPTCSKGDAGIETEWRHAMELVDKTIDAMHNLERRLDTECWEPGTDKWEAAVTMGLIVMRIFELSKVNLAGTGYKIWKHMAKALQARSKAIKTAINCYNLATDSMIPHKVNLSWEEVVEYVFLSDFNLLHERGEDIRDEPWAHSAGHVAMDQDYKLLHTDKEIVQLNVEIQCLITYMADVVMRTAVLRSENRGDATRGHMQSIYSPHTDEEGLLVHHEKRLHTEGEDVLAYQHMEWLVKLSKEMGFSSCISSSVSVCREHHACIAPDMARCSVVPDDDVPMRDSARELTLVPEESDDENNEDTEDLVDAFTHVVQITIDGGVATEGSNV
ncbi:hypothetical protein B0H17DRAFT_1209145 [Mycena rosella]|uniref:Uncharacterized protein n=1 Tax=Mycena rosella TaxID=1033263 RepID=A0AAD7CZE5_MYCRO|nr:hypothetical protein B0H17DRAFT_1209145 [Mycena rosella]